MNVKLELQFQSLAELKTYVDQTTQALSVIPVVTQPKEVMAGPQDDVAPTIAPQEVVTPPPVASPVEPAPTTVSTEPTAAPAPAPAVSTAATSYTLDDLARAGAQLVELGKQPEMPGLLQRFGIVSLPELPKDKYGEFAAAMREMGARI